MGRRVLVLAVDVDDDLHEKAGMKGPLVGRKAVLEGASKLALSDPSDSDSNTMFEAVRTADTLGKEEDVEVAVVTGSHKLGYAADREVAEQLESVLDKFKPEGCVFVSDGASDEQVLPLIQSRVKVDSVKTVVVKQTKELEKTYFVILDKLKDPVFIRPLIIVGITLLLYSFSGGIALRVFAALLGIYIIIKSLGIEDALFRKVSHLNLSFERVSFVFTFASVLMAIAAFWLAGARAVSLYNQTESLKLVAIFLKDLMLLLPTSVLLLIAGEAIESLVEGKIFALPTSFVLSSVTLVSWLLISSLSDWTLGDADFGSFFSTLVLGAATILFSILFARELRKKLLAKSGLEGKEVYSEIGSFMGKVIGVNPKKGTMILQTTGGQKLDLDFENISRLGEKLLVKL
jgi:putative membrane protein